MDRSKRDELPKMPVNFIDGICLGLYEVCPLCDCIVVFVFWAKSRLYFGSIDTWKSFRLAKLLWTCYCIHLNKTRTPYKLNTDTSTMFQSLEKVNPLFRPLLDGCLSNRRHWSNLFERRTSFADITSANICLSTTNMSRVCDYLLNWKQSDSFVDNGHFLQGCLFLRDSLLF